MLKGVFSEITDILTHIHVSIKCYSASAVSQSMWLRYTNAGYFADIFIFVSIKIVPKVARY